MPTQFCNLHYVLKVTYVLFENFFLYCRYLCEMSGVVLLVTFIMPVIYPLFIAIVVISCLCLSELLSGNLCI